MTVSNQTNRTSVVGDGTTQEIPFSFPVSATSDIEVRSRVIATGVESDPLTENSDYTVSLSGDSGGTVTMITTFASTYQIHVKRNTPMTQLLDLEQGGSFNAENIEDALDKNTKLSIENADSLDRTLRFPETDADSIMEELPKASTRAGKFLYFGASDGNPSVAESITTGETTISTYGKTLIDDDNASAALTTLGFTPYGKTLIDDTSALVARGTLGLDTDDDVEFAEITSTDIITKSPWADVRAYGAVGNGTTDDTTAIQDALDASPAVLYFPAGTYKTGVLEIKANIHIRGDNATLLGSGNGLFNVLTALDKVYIEGFTVTWSSAAGTIGKQFFWNGDQAAGSTSFDLGTIYAITNLRIWNNYLGSSRIAAGGATTIARVYDNHWVHANTVAITPAYLYLERGDVDSDSGPVWVEGNYFSVYPPSGVNKDIIKVTGGITEAVICNNYVENKTTDSGAQMDVFTGAHKMRFIGNSLINITLERKQVKGALPAMPTIYHYDLIMGNTFELQDGWDLVNRAIYFVGALSTITNNQFIIKNSASQCYAIDFDAGDTDITFDTDQAVANIVSNNIFDLRSAEATSGAIQFQPTGGIGSDVGRYMVVSGNLQLGGEDFFAGTPKYASMIGNIWGDSGSSIGTSINAGLASMAIGNVADTTTPIYAGRDSGNMVTKSVTALANEATPSILGLGEVVLTGGTTTITDLDDGYAGQTITILCKHSLTFDFTTAQDADHNLDGSSANITVDTGDILKFLCENGTTWHLISNLDASVDNN